MGLVPVARSSQLRAESTAESIEEEPLLTRDRIKACGNWLFFDVHGVWQLDDETFSKLNERLVIGCSPLLLLPPLLLVVVVVEVVVLLLLLLFLFDAWSLPDASGRIGWETSVSSSFS